MNYLYKKIIFVCVALSIFESASASKIIIQAPHQTLSNRQPVVVQVFLDGEGQTLSGISGNFSYPSDMFTLADVDTSESVVSLWAKQPGVSEEKYIDGRTHITFEGIFPGGYDGVRSPYYKGSKSGIVFSVTLIPKNKGIGSLAVDDLTLNAFNSEATPLPTSPIFSTIVVPDLLPEVVITSKEITFVKSPTLMATISQDVLVNNNAWYLMVYERDEKSAIQNIQVAETNDYTPETLTSNMWRDATNPYILLYQDRTKYVHVKVTYSNNTYTIKTIAPVENSKSISLFSRILISVIIVLSLVYIYGKNLISFFSKKK